ncbi:uncharacterized protein RCO7_00693 [Rhynchosporium graminicola]|uniref:DUF7923 domain-containing protein n=1 Tax=Rhynchosporium graminicola TaxID=2792576 RepID=A0A1E1K256_9HELO|nr:uncharacterized protein RCO7_00693 [Rhynchosporium commune]
MVSLDVFQEEFRKLKEVDHRKDQLIERLILQVEEFQINLTEKKLHLEREQTTTKVYQSKHKEVRDELKKLEEDIRSNNFVSVLIDGDCMPFLDALVILAQQGGLEAVRCLRNKVCEYVSKELKLPSNIAVRIRVYANIKGLASAYFFNKVLERQDDLSMFIRGFNMGHPMCDFVDAGDGKECADAKLKAWFDHDVADVQCRAVFLGGSADNGYARLLQPHVGDNLEKDRIVLIEGPPFATELAVLRDSFIVARFPDVFRTTKLPARRVSFTTTPPRTPVPPTYAATIGRAVDAVRRSQCALCGR